MSDYCSEFPYWDFEREFEAKYEVKGEEDLLGKGTYGSVYRGTCRKTEEVVAIKKMKMDGEEEGVPSTALREISLLKGLVHRNVVALRDTFISPNKVTLVFDFFPNDLKKYMKSHGCDMPPDEIKSLTHQLCLGMAFCHASRILHRDLKPQNLLVTADKVLKVADFGLARIYSLPSAKYTQEVVTVWYRAPEILLGETLYSLPIDVWSMGCVLGEMAAGRALFPGDSEIGTIMKIFEKLGTPTEERWSAWKKGRLPNFSANFPNWPRRGWEAIPNVASKLGEDGMSLLDHLMEYDPRKRIAAQHATKHAYFDNMAPVA
mmetsp:Transcript_54203/g.129142  ORF Transcript_54203/g.129142 Transcript_54203/m.129142 type:complete len:318 (-) Transcript_54203:219-1172(-)|eukprot:CAMPEP_0178423852 /NCGR_PEP_ID=MMETSP0689_2-20121128/27901_1 /TAXON_ID=160604 /ORGANISM="Amphidinium massartii, Strain CS-259" /LENGTH=317 /DNA_ID=CAMNT_0020045457 /DNA_START=137 /DNA_END=1090 /DNA_ORIENTATION=-